MKSKKMMGSAEAVRTPPLFPPRRHKIHFNRRQWSMLSEHKLELTTSMQVSRTTRYRCSTGTAIERAIFCRTRRGVDGIAVLFAGVVARGVFGSSKMLTLASYWSFFLFRSGIQSTSRGRRVEGGLLVMLLSRALDFDVSMAEVVWV